MGIIERLENEIALLKRRVLELEQRQKIDDLEYPVRYYKIPLVVPYFGKINITARIAER